MDIADVSHCVLENKQSLFESHSADGASVYVPIKYVFQKYNYNMYQTCITVQYSTHTLSYIYRLSNSNCYLPKSRSEPGKNPKY
jgi:hypothetical protein